MLELISIFCSLALIVVTPMQTAQICAGKISPKFKGTPEAYVASFRKQVGLLLWLGVVLGVLNLGLIFIESEPGEWIINVVSAVLWLGVFGVALYSRQRLAKLPAPAQPGGAAT